MVAPLIESSAPGWAVRFAARLEAAFVSRFPKAPIRLAPFTVATLPPAADWPGSLVYVTDKGKAGLSNGATWTDPSGGVL